MSALNLSRPSSWTPPAQRRLRRFPKESLCSKNALSCPAPRRLRVFPPEAVFECSLSPEMFPPPKNRLKFRLSATYRNIRGKPKFGGPNELNPPANNLPEINRLQIRTNRPRREKRRETNGIQYLIAPPAQSAGGPGLRALCRQPFTARTCKISPQDFPAVSYISVEFSPNHPLSIAEPRAYRAA